MDDNIITVEDPHDRHPWGGTVVSSEIQEPVYSEVVAKRIGNLYMDMGNAIATNFLDIIAQQVKSSSDNVINADIHHLLMGDDEIIFDYYLANTLSLSHFEATMFLILTEQLAYRNSPIGGRIVRYFLEEREHWKVIKMDEESEKREVIVDLIGSNYTAAKYIRLIDDTLEITDDLSVPDDLFDHFRNIRGERGSVVHNLTSLIQSGDEDTVKSQMSQCDKLVTKSSKWQHEKLTIHQGIIQSLQ